MTFTPPCVSGCGCNRCKKKHDRGSYLKFSGSLTSDGTSQTFYLGDAGPVSSPPTTPISYPAARRGRLKDLAVNITPATLVPVNGLISVQLFKNGSPLADFLITFIAGETTGIKSVKTSKLKLSTDDLFDLRVSIVGVQATIVVTATVGVVD